MSSWIPRLNVHTTSAVHWATIRTVSPAFPQLPFSSLENQDVFFHNKRKDGERHWGLFLLVPPSRQHSLMCLSKGASAAINIFKTCLLRSRIPLCEGHCFCCEVILWKYYAFILVGRSLCLPSPDTSCWCFKVPSATLRFSMCPLVVCPILLTSNPPFSNRSYIQPTGIVQVNLLVFHSELFVIKTETRHQTNEQLIQIPSGWTNNKIAQIWL